MARPYRLLLVCSGNICRSPMAEGIARSYAASRDRPVEVCSAGTLGLVDHPADAKAVAVCAQQGVDIAAHRSQALSDELVDWADYILVMEFHHANHVREHHPVDEGKVVMLGTFGGELEIGDPIGGWKFTFRRNRDVIRRCVEGFVDRLRPEGIDEPD